MNSYYVIIFLFLTTFSFSQEKNQLSFLFSYEGRKDDSLILQEDFVLITEDEQSIFTSYTRLQKSKEFKSQLKTKTIKLSKKRKSKFNYTIIKENNEFKYYDRIAGGKLMYRETLDKKSWSIQNETKHNDNDSELTKATIEYGGRNWVAWFNPNIPISNGPYVFSGLPGLIEEIYDVDFVHHFKLKGSLDEYFEEGDYKVEQAHNYQKVSYEKFLNYREKVMENYYESFNSNSSIKLPPISVEKKKEYNKKKQDEFIPIELE